MRLSTLSFVAGLAAMSGSAFANPTINGAAINQFVYHDSAASNLTVVNNYPAQVQFTETNVVADGGPDFANRHNFRLSSNAGVSNAQFNNGDAFSIFSDLTLTSGNAEAGLSVSPWWDQNNDGNLIVTTGGAVFAAGGRLPFYSFGNPYVSGTTVRIGIVYEPQGLSMSNPGQIQYWYNGIASPWLNFDQGNALEDPPHGLWGDLTSTYVGGYVQNVVGTPGGGVANFQNIVVTPAPGAASLLALGGLIATRRRR